MSTPFWGGHIFDLPNGVRKTLLIPSAGAIFQIDFGKGVSPLVCSILGFCHQLDMGRNSLLEFLGILGHAIYLRGIQKGPGR